MLIELEVEVDKLCNLCCKSVWGCLVRWYLILDLTSTGLGCVAEGFVWSPEEGKCFSPLSTCESQVDYAGNNVITNVMTYPAVNVEDCIEYCTTVPGAKFITKQRSWPQPHNRVDTCYCKSSDAGRREIGYHSSCRINWVKSFLVMWSCELGYVRIRKLVIFC